MRILKSVLADKLKHMKNIVLPKNFEGLQGVLVKGGQLIATNLELTIISNITGTAQDETFLIPQNAIPFIESLPETEIEIKPIKKQIAVTGGGTSAKFAALDASQFPEINETEVSGKCKINGSDLKKAIASVISSSDAASTKTLAQGVYFDGDGTKLNLVASDGTRMSWVQINSQENMSMLIPKDTLKKVVAMIEDEGTVTVFRSKDRKKANIITDDYIIQTRLINAKYMDYKPLFSVKDEVAKVTVERTALLLCVNRCFLCGDRSIQSPAVMKILGDGINISKQNTTAEFNENVVASCASLEEGTTLKLGFSAGNIVAVLKTFDMEKVDLHYNGELKPLIITAEGSALRHLVVPMRLIG